MKCIGHSCLRVEALPFPTHFSVYKETKTYKHECIVMRNIWDLFMCISFLVKFLMDLFLTVSIFVCPPLVTGD